MATTLSRPDAPARGRMRADLVAVGAAGLLVAVAVVVGRHLLERGVTLYAPAAPFYASWHRHVGPGTVPAVVLALLVVVRGPELAERMRWRPLLVLAGAAALGWTVSLALVDGWRVGVAERLSTRWEYLHDVPRVSDVGAMLRTFSDHILADQPGSWTTHVAAHPPGALLVFVALDRLGLRGGGPAGVLCILVGSSACVAVAVSLRALGAGALARAALPFGVLLPGAVWVGVSADGLFAGVLAWGVALLALGAARAGVGGWLLAVGGGLLLGYLAYLSYGLVLAGLLPLAVALALRRGWPLLAAGVGVAAVVVGFTAAGFWWLDGYRLVTVLYHQPRQLGTERPYGYWVWADLAVLAVVVGPAAVAGLRRLLGGRLALACHAQPLALLCGAAGLAVLVADLSGLSKAEVERIWLPFGVWLVAAAGVLPRRFARGALAAQALVGIAVEHLLSTPW